LKENKKINVVCVVESYPEITPNVFHQDGLILAQQKKKKKHFVFLMEG
jgi:hypothetical protein